MNIFRNVFKFLKFKEKELYFYIYIYLYILCLMFTGTFYRTFSEGRKFEKLRKQEMIYFTLEIRYH